MKDLHGERVIVQDVVNFLNFHYRPDQELLIMVGEDGPNGAPGRAAIMVWDQISGTPSKVALNFPVFTLMPDFYRRDDAPGIVSYSIQK